MQQRSAPWPSFVSLAIATAPVCSLLPAQNVDHEHVVPGQRAMVTALRDARGSPSAFQVLQRKKAKPFRVHDRIVAEQVHVLAPQSLCFPVNACPEEDAPRATLDACNFGALLNNCSCWKNRRCR